MSFEVLADHKKEHLACKHLLWTSCLICDCLGQINKTVLFEQGDLESVGSSALGLAGCNDCLRWWHVTLHSSLWCSQRLSVIDLTSSVWDTDLAQHWLLHWSCESCTHALKTLKTRVKRRLFFIYLLLIFRTKRIRASFCYQTVFVNQVSTLGIF